MAVARFNTAYDVYDQAGFAGERLINHLQGIDYTQSVDVATLNPGTNYVQYVLNDNVGNYFAEVGTPAETLGINQANRVATVFTPTRELMALRSTAAPIVDTWTAPGEPFAAQGGGIQLFVSDAGSMIESSNPVVGGGVKIATEQPAMAGQGTSDLLNQMREAGGTLPVVRGQVTVQDIAAASRAGGNEVAYFRDRATGQLYLRELGPQMGEIPINSRLILHTQPGEGFLAVQPSSADRAALTLLNQRSSVIVNSEGTFAIRFRPLNTGDGNIQAIGDW